MRLSNCLSQSFHFGTHDERIDLTSYWPHKIYYNAFRHPFGVQNLKPQAMPFPYDFGFSVFWTFLPNLFFSKCFRSLKLKFALLVLRKKKLFFFFEKQTNWSKMVKLNLHFKLDRLAVTLRQVSMEIENLLRVLLLNWYLSLFCFFF